MVKEEQAQEMSLVKANGEVPALTIEEMASRVQRIKDLMRVVLKKDTHYGIIPGCKKPSLWKPGAEQIAVCFLISIIQSKVEDLSKEDYVHYRITQEAYDKGGRLLGSATGECSSLEDKYRWHKPVCDEEYNDAPKTHKREIWKKEWKANKLTAVKVKQVRITDPSINNTILQQADKRAYVAVTRKVTACSDIFTQDLEDIPDEYLPKENHKEVPKKKEGDKLSPEWIKSLKERLKEAAMPETDLLIMLGYESLKDIPKSRVNDILDKIKEYTGDKK